MPRPQYRPVRYAVHFTSDSAAQSVNLNPYRAHALCVPCAMTLDPSTYRARVVNTSARCAICDSVPTL